MGKLDGLGVEYLLLEKFYSGTTNYKWYALDPQREILWKDQDRYIQYQNNSFVLLKTRTVF